MQHVSRKPGLPLLSYATCVRVTPTPGYNALIAAHCNFCYGVFLRHTPIAPADVGIDRTMTLRPYIPVLPDRLS